MKVVILCGGLGTRLREETEFKPKPMVEIGGLPILLHIMKICAHHGLRDFVLCLGYKGHVIRRYFLDYAARNQGENDNFRITLAETGEDTMTGGRLAKVQKYIGDESFMLCYGDHLANVNISALVEYHKSHGRLATVTTAPHVSQFGVITTDDHGRAIAFREKPLLEGAISIGFFVLNPGVFGYLGGDECIFEQTPIRRLVEDGELMAFHHSGFEAPMDTYRDHEMLNALWQSGNAPWKTWKD